MEFQANQYHVVWNEEHRKWVLKSDKNDVWIRSSFYKSWAIRKGAKYCKENRNPCQLIIHTKDGHEEEVRHYHK